MPSLKKITFRNEAGNEYEIELSLNDAAIMDDHVDIDIHGRQRRSPEEEWTEESFTARFDYRNAQLLVLYRGERIGVIDLNDADILENAVAAEEDGDEGSWEVISNWLEDNGESVEHVIDHIPAIDPVFGCLIRAGLSTTIGQFISCYPQVRRASETRWQWIANMLRCLGVNSFVMMAKFTKRTIRCALGAGWGLV